MSDRKRFSFIVNPEAGRGNSKKLDETLHSLLKGRNVDYTIAKTKGSKDGINLARNSAKVSDVVVAVGGDGTANEVANGIIGSNASMGVIPTGSGNDFAKMLGMSQEIEKSVDDILVARTEHIDSGTVRLKDSHHRESVRKFVNSIGIGFDAIVAYESQQIKQLKGVPLYLMSIFRSLKKLKPHTFEMIFDGKAHKEDYYLVCVGNGTREGGGFYVTPGAHPSDGVFKVCTVKQVSLLRALRILPTILKGEHGRFSEVDLFDAQRMRIGSKKPFLVHCDGEIVGTDNETADVELNPRSLRVVVGRDGLQTVS